MILVNGTEGIGTGFMTKIPCYNPLDLIKILTKMLNDNYPVLNYIEEYDESQDIIIVPWYHGFKG